MNMKFFRKISLIPKGLRYKLMIAFCLMSVIPLLVAVYFVRGQLFSPSGDVVSVSLTLFFCLVIAFLGLILAKQIVEPVIEMALQAKLIAEGDLTRDISVGGEGEDEIGYLAQSINQLTRRIKGNMEELKVFGEKTKRINTEIHKRVLALSSLLQIGENISASVQMEDVMTLIIEKVVQMMDAGYALLFLPKGHGSSILECNIDRNLCNEKLSQLEVKIGAGLLGSALAEDRTIYADSKTKPSREIENFKNDYGIKNFAVFAIISHGNPVGMLLIGNEIERFEFKNDDLELIRVFAKQAALAYESDELMRKTKELAIKDDLTNLFNEKYVTTRLDEEIKRAIFYQRPCSYILFNVDNFTKFREENGELATEKALMRIASVLKDNVTQVGRAARLSGDEFALLLPEKNKKEAYRIAEEVRKGVQALVLEADKTMSLTMSGGVSENPLDGSTAEELMEKAAASVLKAKSQGKNKIV